MSYVAVLFDIICSIPFEILLAFNNFLARQFSLAFRSACLKLYLGVLCDMHKEMVPDIFSSVVSYYVGILCGMSCLPKRILLGISSAMFGVSSGLLKWNMLWEPIGHISRYSIWHFFWEFISFPYTWILFSAFYLISTTWHEIRLELHFM